MPYIRKQIESDTLDVNGTQTVVIDYEKTRELSFLNENFFGISLKEIEELKEKFYDNKKFSKFLDYYEEFPYDFQIEIKNVEVFYEILWKRVVLELVFMINWYTKEIINPDSFQSLIKNNSTFDSWFTNTVKFTMLTKIKAFYKKLAEFYASKVSIDIFEIDVEIMSKEICDNINDIYIEDVKNYLNYEWDKAKEYNKDVFAKKRAEKIKTILFD